MTNRSLVVQIVKYVMKTANISDLRANLFLQSRSVSVIFISPEIAELSTGFDKKINSDPADRIIAATSIVRNAQLISADINLRQSDRLDTVG